MAHLIYKRFKDLPAPWQHLLDEQYKADELARREHLLKMYTNRLGDPEQALREVEDVWWARLSYINNWTHDADYLCSVCSNCGCPTNLMKVLYDRPSGDCDRDCGFKCECGAEFHHIYE